VFARDAEGLTAGRQHPHPGAADDESLRQRRRRLDDLLAVVKDDQDLALPERLGERLGDWAPGFLPDPEHLCDRTGDERRVRYGRQVDEPNAIPRAVERFRCRLESKTGLAHPARARQSHESGRSEQAPHLGHLAVAPDEARNLFRQVVLEPRVVQRTEGCELAGQAFGAYLEDPFRPPEVFQAVVAQVPEGHVVRQVFADQLGGEPRDHDLAAMGDGLEAGRPVDHRSEVVAAAFLAVAGVQRHPHPDRCGVRPGLRRQGLLDRDRDPEGGWGVVEGGAEGVTDGFEHVPAGPLDRGPLDLVVAGERDFHLLGVGLPRLGRSLDVRE
jgi:hypothetical protein